MYGVWQSGVSKMVCDKVVCERWCTFPTKARLPHESQPKARRQPRAPQLLQKALCAAPATRKPAAGQAATTRAAAPPEGSVHCACTKASRGPGGDHARRSSSRRLCVLRLPHESQPRARRRPRAPQLLQQALCAAPATRKPAAGQAATTRPAAPPEGSVCCACHTKASRRPRRSSSSRLCVLRLPHESQPRARRRPGRSSSRWLCVLRLPRESQPRARRRPGRSSSRKLCVLRLPHESQPRARRRPRAPQLLQQALCAAPATGKPATGQAATTHAAAPPEGSVCCACHTKASRGPGGDHARSSSSRRLCLCAAPATRKPAEGQAATTRAAALPDGSVYCACHTKASWWVLCDMAVTRGVISVVWYGCDKWCDKK